MSLVVIKATDQVDWEARWQVLTIAGYRATGTKPRGKQVPRTPKGEISRGVAYSEWEIEARRTALCVLFEKTTKGELKVVRLEREVVPNAEKEAADESSVGVERNVRSKSSGRGRARPNGAGGSSAGV